MTKLRKALVVGVMSMTVLSMSVVVAPEAGAAASAGDLIKMDGLSSVYYLGTDNKRYVFPNEKTYFSWYSDFSDVVTVPQSELESYPLGANVTVRPGTKLVKITTDPKVYATEPGGDLVHIPDEATAQALYGANWADRVIDVPDAFFTNYTVTGEQASSDAFPAGSLVKFGEDATVYYINEAGEARPIQDEAAFMANHFSFDDVIETDMDMPTEGDAVTGMEVEIFDPSAGAGGVAGAGTGLTVSLAGDTAASANIPSCSTLVPWATYNFTASNDGDVTINNLVLTRRGAGSYDSFSGGYLYVGNERLTTKRSVNSSENTVTFTALNLNIPAGMTKAVTLKMNAEGTGSACSTTNTDNHYFEIAASSDVDTNGAVVSGSFPIAGNTLAYASVQASDVTLTGTTGGTTYKIGETDVTLAEFTIANGTEEVVDVYRLRLKQNGTATDDALNNISLDLDGTIVAEGISMEDRYIDFMLDTPHTIDKSETVTATVRGEIVGDIDKTIDLYANNVADFDVRGSAYGNNYSANVLISDFEAGDVTDINITGSEVDVSFDGPAAQEIKDDSKDVVLANFKIKTNNLDVNIESVRVVLAMGSSVAGDNLTNIEMVDSGNNISYSVSDPSGGATSHDLDFENIYLQAGTQYNFEIRGDVPDGATTGQTYSVSIDFTDSTGTFTARFQDENETAVDEADMSSATLTGKTMTVAAPSVTFSKVTTANATYVENSDDVLLFKGKITANSVDDLTVSKVRLYDHNGTAAYIGDSFEKVYLYKVNGDGTETELDSETSLDAVAYASFSGFTLNIPKGTSNGVYITVRGDVKNNPDADTLSMRWGNYSDDSVATTTMYTVRDSDNDSLDTSTQYTIKASDNGQTTTIAAQGSFTMAMDTELNSLNNDKNVLAGSEVLMARVKVTAADEEVKIEDFALKNFGTAAADDIAYVRVYADKEMTGKLGEANLTSGLAYFEDINIEIPTTGITYLYIAGVVKTIDYSNSPGADSTADAEETVKWGIASTTGYTVKAVGVSTGETLANSGVANYSTSTLSKKSTIMGATLSNITTDFANGTLVAGANKKVFSFKVTAPDSSNYDTDGSPLPVKIATTTFNISTTTGAQAGTFKVERVGGSAGKLDAKYGGVTDTVTVNNEFVISLIDTFSGNETDLEILPGETATFDIFATVQTDGTNDSMQVYIEDAFDADMQYTHNTGSYGVDAADATAVYPLLSGITDITGGTLTN